jgi:predicted DNA-binding antitoxin AbrB/MazE fold protein
MSLSIEATYDGTVLRPDETLPLKPNTRVRVTVEEMAPAPAAQASFLQTAMALHLSGPPDWSANLDNFCKAGTDSSD